MNGANDVEVSSEYVRRLLARVGDADPIQCLQQATKRIERL